MTEKELLEKLRKLRSRVDEMQDDISALCLVLAAAGIREDAQLPLAQHFREMTKDIYKP